MKGCIELNHRLGVTKITKFPTALTRASGEPAQVRDIIICGQENAPPQATYSRCGITNCQHGNVTLGGVVLFAQLKLPPGQSPAPNYGPYCLDSN